MGAPDVPAHYQFKLENEALHGSLVIYMLVVVRPQIKYGATVWWCTATQTVQPAAE